MLAAVSVASAGGATLRVEKQNRVLTEGHGQADTSAAQHMPLELLLLLLLMRTDTPMGQGTQRTHTPDAAHPDGGCEAS